MGVIVSVNGCLSLYVSPVMSWGVVQAVAQRLPHDAGIGFSPSTTLNWISSRKWING